jgi:hypothetical protein
MRNVEVRKIAADIGCSWMENDFYDLLVSKGTVNNACGFVWV